MEKKTCFPKGGGAESAMAPGIDSQIQDWHAKWSLKIHFLVKFCLLISLSSLLDLWQLLFQSFHFTGYIYYWYRFQKPKFSPASHRSRGGSLPFRHQWVKLRGHCSKQHMCKVYHGIFVKLFFFISLHFVEVTENCTEALADVQYSVSSTTLKADGKKQVYKIP